MTGLGRSVEIVAISMALLLLAYLVELARDNGILIKSLGVAALILIASIGLCVIWFRY